MTAPDPHHPDPPPPRWERKVNIFFLGFIAIAFLIVLVPVGLTLMFWVALSAEEELRVVSSPGDRHQLHVNTTAAWIYGPHGIVLRLKQGNRTVETYSTQLANDGANLFEDNAQVKWGSETVAHVCLQGEEQEPAGIQLTLEPRSGWRGGMVAAFEEDPDSCRFWVEPSGDGP